MKSSKISVSRSGQSIIRAVLLSFIGDYYSPKTPNVRDQPPEATYLVTILLDYIANRKVSIGH